MLRRRPEAAAGVRRAWPWGCGALAVIVAAVVIVAVAGTRPSFDAYGWLVWGHQTLHGDLDTNAAPSFKPLPYVFTVAWAPFGGAQRALWMVTAIAVSLAGLGFAGRLAHRLSGAGGLAGGVAATVAVVGVLCLHDEFPFGYAHYVLSAQSDPMIVALLLAAADCALCGRPRWTFWLLVAAALGRPEAWPFLLADAAWLWRARPGMRPWLLAGVAVVGLLWFGVPALTSRSWLVAADNADASGFGPRGDRAAGTLSRLVIQVPWPLWIAAAAAALDGARRRDRAVSALAAAVVAWAAIEVGFALHGWPALGRYLFEASAVAVVLGAAAVGRGLAWAGAGSGGGVGAGRGPLRIAGGAAAVAVIAGTAVIAVGQARDARGDLRAQHARTASIGRLGRLVARLGGPSRLRACGEPISRGLAFQTVLAYTVRRNVSAVGYRFPQPGHPHDPVVVFTPLPGGGWRARALRQVRPGCPALERRGRVVIR